MTWVSRTSREARAGIMRTETTCPTAQANTRTGLPGHAYSARRRLWLALSGPDAQWRGEGYRGVALWGQPRRDHALRGPLLLASIVRFRRRTGGWISPHEPHVR